MKDTIVAPATPIGRGGVGVVRISGPDVKSIAIQMIGKLPEPRYAHYGEFKDLNGDLIDEGLALFFPNPHSFTGEDVLELQGHGGPVIMDMLVQAIIKLGARMARPGEFSERAFLNDKMDLVQAEAIADLIDASSQKAAKSALNSLKGAFSEQIQLLLTQLIDVRTYVEAAIDFPEEEIDFLTEGKVADQVRGVLARLDSVQNQANQGRILTDGMKIVILGKPNAGKSSLLNALSGEDSAIVTDVPGTTRDILKEHIQINGMPVHIIDTAGLRATDDKVEAIGVDRALKAAAGADRLLVVMDVADKTALNDLQSEFKALFELNIPITSIYNKIDLKTKECHPDDAHSQARHPDDAQHPSGPIRQKPQTLFLSAKTGKGIDDLKTHLQNIMGFEQSTDGTFSARRRHLDALEKAREHIVIGLEKVEKSRAGELLAEELRLAQNHLSEITGEFRADDLLGVIFSSFCIGK